MISASPFAISTKDFSRPQNEPAPLPLWTPLHYKDAFALLLTHWHPTSSACRFGAAAGPETYFDTTAKKYPSAYGDRHGTGLRSQPVRAMQSNPPIGSRIDGHPLVRRREFRFFNLADRSPSISTPQDLDDSDRGEHRVDAPGDGRLEITAGRVDIDDFNVAHDDGTTTWITYGRKLQGSIGWDASLLREQVAGVMGRRGGALQVTAQHDFWAPWIQVFAGIGPYVAHAIDRERGTSNTQINLLMSYGVRIAVGNRFSLVAKLGRVAASSGRNDADLVTVGFSLKAP